MCLDCPLVSKFVGCGVLFHTENEKEKLSQENVLYILLPRSFILRKPLISHDNGDYVSF